MTAPNTQESEPTLTEAFSEFSEALIAEEDGTGGVPSETATDEGEPQAGEADAAEAKPDQQQQPATDKPGAETQPQQPGQPGQQPTQPEQKSEPERQPLTYTVDGQQRSFDGAFVLPGLGAVITADALPKLQDRLQQADRLVAQNQYLYQQTQEIAKLGGRAAFDKLSAEKAMLDASATLLLRALGDEATLVALATDPLARQQLIKEVHLTAREAQFQATNAARETVAREEAASQTTFRTQTAIHNAVGELAQEFQGLTADDVQVVRQHAARMHAAIVRPATPDEAREANVQVGAPIIDVAMLHALLADRHALRTSAFQEAQRRQTDTLENAARAHAAAPTTVVTNGKSAAPAPRPGAGKAPAAPAQKPLDKMTSAELTRAMRSGRIFDMIGDDDEQ